MSPYIETIRIQEGELMNLSYHQERFERTRRLELGLSLHPELTQVIQIPDGLDQGKFKCRILYGAEIERIEYEPFTRHLVSSLKLVHADHIVYNYKYSDRNGLQELYDRRGACDDILIVKQGCISDSFYANTVFWDGREWFTPDTPLLPGTKRASLLDQGLLRLARIKPENLRNYLKVGLINAMNDLNEGPGIPIDKVIL